MRLDPLRRRRHGRWLWILAAVAAGAAAQRLGADASHRLATVWVPATAYGLTLITVFKKDRT